MSSDYKTTEGYEAYLEAQEPRPAIYDPEHYLSDAEKDIEIERLKAQVKELSEAYQKAIGPIRPAHSDLKKLIIELADALEEWTDAATDGGFGGEVMASHINLIRRARETTR